MIDAVRRHLWAIVFFLACCSGAGVATWQAYEMGNGLTPWDHDSEANVLREVDGWRAQGFWHDSGLGNVLYGDRYPDWGFAAVRNRAHTVGPDGIYTHYPPGPEYLIYLAEAAVGPDSIFLLRLVPLTVCAAAAVFLGFSVRRRFGATVGWLVMAACLSVTPFHDADSYLHFIGYALALLLVEVGIAIGRNRAVLPFLLLGFLQGWLSFDWVFLAVLCPLAVEWAMPSIVAGHVARTRLALLRTVCVGAGFVTAHALHFAEVWAHYGSLPLALDDLHAAAAYRAGYGEAHGAGTYALRAFLLVMFHLISPYPVSVLFWQAFGNFATRVFRFMGVTLGVWWIILSVLLALAERGRRLQGMPRLHLLKRWCAVSLLGLVPSALWWLLMQNHAYEHPYLQYRHLFFFFLMMVLFISVQIAPSLEAWIERRGGALLRAQRTREPAAPAAALVRQQAP